MKFFFQKMLKGQIPDAMGTGHDTIYCKWFNETSSFWLNSLDSLMLMEGGLSDKTNIGSFNP